MALILLISIVWKKFKLPTPPKVWVSSFLGVNGNGISLSAIMKKLKNGSHFINIDCMEKFRIDSGYCSDQAKVKSAYGRSGKGFPVGKINSSQTGTIVVVIKQSLGSWSHMWSLNNVNGCGSTSLFGSRAGTHQGK